MYLKLTEECKNGNHAGCAVHSPPLDSEGNEMFICGGWMCTCQCHREPSTVVPVSNLVAQIAEAQKLAHKVKLKLE